jgi:ABC-type amino acid transport substrate-binding protein
MTVDVDRIVSEVIRRLSVLPGDRESPITEEDLSPRLEGRVVTLAALPRSLAGGSVTIPRDAIITPAARDELQNRGVQVHYSEVTTTAIAGKARLYAAVVAAKQSTSSLTKLIRAIEPSAEFEEVATQEAAVGAAVSAIENGQVSAIWTDRPAAAVCLSNRHEDVWAACGQDMTAIREAARTIPLNLLVVDSRIGVHLQQSVLRTFLQSVG